MDTYNPFVLIDILKLSPLILLVWALWKWLGGAFDTRTIIGSSHRPEKPTDPPWISATWTAEEHNSYVHDDLLGATATDLPSYVVNGVDDLDANLMNQIIDKVKSLEEQVEPQKVVVKCLHCGQWAAVRTSCVHCGAPVG